MDENIDNPQNVAHQVTPVHTIPHQVSSHPCLNQEKITRLEEKVKTLFVEHDKLNLILYTMNSTFLTKST